MAANPAYTYAIKEIVKYVDGDTVDVVIDLGFFIFVKKRVRLHGINAPESRTRDLKEKARGLAAKKKIVELCETDYGDGPNLVLKCHGLGKYGRVVGEIFNHNTSVNRMMVITGNAEEYLL